jgi:DNA-binding NtrC family response regulator
LSGAEAIDIASREPIVLTLLDIRMPGMDGIKTLKELKEVNEKMIVIIITAYGALKTARKAMELGAYDYLTKPLDFGFINSLIKEGLEQEKAQN